MYWRLRRQAVLFDVPERPILVEGPDAEKLLDRVLTRDVSRLEPGRAAYAISCADDGGILMDGVLVRFSRERFWYVLADGDYLGWLTAHARGLDVAIADPQVWVAQIQGPASLDVLAAACDGPAPEPFPYFGVSEARIGGTPVVVTRTGWSGELGFEVYVPPEVDGGALWDRLLESGAPFGLAAQSLDSLGIRRIEAGILDNGTDIDPGLTPFAAGLGRFVDLEKESFVGREALARADRRQLLHGIVCPHRTPAAGSPVARNGVEVGRTTTGAWSPHLRTGIGYVRFTQPGDWVGTEIEVGPERDEARVVALPFYDAERFLPRGLTSPPSPAG